MHQEPYTLNIKKVSKRLDTVVEKRKGMSYQDLYIHIRLAPREVIEDQLIQAGAPNWYITNVMKGHRND